jgi:KDO2-lipid IV(A) lauroyltransferase
VVGEENLHRARSLGRGVFILSAHIGGWELGAIRAGMLASRSRPWSGRWTTPCSNASSRAAERGLATGRSPNATAARDILKALRRGETVAILVDQNVLAREAVFVPFLRTTCGDDPGARPLPAQDRRPRGTGLHLARGRRTLSPRIRDADRGRRGRRRGPRRGGPGFDGAIHGSHGGRDPKAPEVWLWMHNRWRTRPEDR